MTGIITSLPPLVEQPPGQSSSNPAGLPGVTYVAAIPSLSQTWTGIQTFASGTIVLQGTGGASQVLRQSTLNGPVTVSQLAFSDISGTIGPIQIPPPTVSTLGGVFSKAAVASQFLTQVGTDGSVSSAQPSVSDISGGAALTRTNDTNVTLTFGGTPTAALLAATSITVAWSGTLAATRGGFGADVSAQSGVPLFAAGVPTFTSTTGSGNFVRATSPTLVTPALGTPASGALTNCTVLPLSGLNTQAAFTFVGNNTGGSATPTAVDIAALTTKASPAAGDFLILSDQAASGAWKKASVSSVGASSGVSSVNGQTGALVSYFPPQGRLTLQTGVPVMITTQSAKTTIYYTPYAGNMIPIYDGTNMVPTATAEISVATTDTTKNPAAIGVSKVNDWFVWNDAGTIRLSHGPDWTNDTTRSAGTALVMVNGLLLNNASITNGPAASRGTYVGTTRSDASSQLNWILGASNTAGNLAVWNAYNRRTVKTAVSDTTATWTYSSAAARQKRGSANNQISFVSGLQEDWISVFNSTSFNLTTGTTAFADAGVALDSIISFDKSLEPNRTNQAGTITQTMTVSNTYSPQLGYHFVAALEASDGTNTATFIGGANRDTFWADLMM